MKLIVGLGNPGSRYDGTRHNVGFAALDKLLAANQLSLDKNKFKADYTVWHRQGDKVILVEPYTYMNLSGEAVLPLMAYYGIHQDDLLVIYDDLDLEVGKIRLRQKGSAGGHNGMKSIIHLLGSQDFKRLKIGIGRPDPGYKVVDHVLAPFKPDQRQAINQATDKAVEIVEAWLDGQDFIAIMNKYN